MKNAQKINWVDLKKAREKVFENLPPRENPRSTLAATKLTA